MQLAGDFAQDLLVAAHGVLKDADPPQTTLVDIAIDGIGRHEVDNGHRLALLAVAVDTTDALLDAHGVPRQVIVDQEVAELEVQAFAAHLGGQEHIQRVPILFGQRKTPA